jgi:hypothetical protein
LPENGPASVIVSLRTIAIAVLAMPLAAAIELFLVLLFPGIATAMLAAAAGAVLRILPTPFGPAAWRATGAAPFLAWLVLLILAH